MPSTYSADSPVFSEDQQGDMRLHREVRRPKVVIGHPRLGRGGSEARVMWLIEAFKSDWDVTVMTTGGWDLAELNAFYGTNIAVDEVAVRIAPIPAVARRFTVSALRGACYQRFARKIAAEYDVRISAYNPTDWGLPAIHFVADFTWQRKISKMIDPPTPGFIYRDSLLRRLYLLAVSAFAKPSGRDVLQDDRLIANSKWTSSLLRQHCGAECATVIYPSVWSEFPRIPWREKESAFVMIGRIAPEKRIERAVAILSEVRKRGFTIKLYLCGKFEDDSYGRQIRKLCELNSNWITSLGQVSGQAKAKLLTSCKFGIQARGAEPFGISVGEMVKAGAIPFCPNDGGQTEILEQPDLLFDTDKEAVEKICAVLKSPEKQRRLRKVLDARANSFSADRFIANVRKHILDKASVNARVRGQEAKRLKVVIGHPMLGRGGSESTLMWLVEALKADYDVTVVTTGGWDLEALNTFYGTQIRESDVKVRIAPVPHLVRNLDAAALRGACFQRFAREIASEYDLRISTYNPTDWGLPGIHFIADFTWHKELRERFDPPTPGFIYKNSLIRKLYLYLAAAYGRPSKRDLLHDDRIIANSQWTADLMERFCGARCEEIMHPPVWTQFPRMSWEQKSEDFVMIGRISPEKRVERAISILEAVRQRGHAIRLHLCGFIGDDAYGQQVAQLCERHSDWVIPEGQVSGTRKSELLASCKYGIQTRGAEPFGIAVAELVKSGAIVFASNDGGQTEIVDHSELLFENDNDAINKIVSVLSNPQKQRELRMHLARKSQNFSAEKFMDASRRAIRQSITVDPDLELNALIKG